MDAIKTTMDNISRQKIGGGSTSNVKQAIFSAYNSSLEGENLNRSINQTLTKAGLDNSPDKNVLPPVIFMVIRI